MGLEILNRIPDSSQKTICGACQHIVRSAQVYEGSVVMVKPRSDTHQRTGFGGSQYFGRVTIPFNMALAVEKNGVIHYQIPVDVEGLSHSGKLASVEIVADNFGHDISTLI